jgi:hypothetical protein
MKIDFPRFRGEDPSGWLSFNPAEIHNAQLLTAYLVDGAIRWVPFWEEFSHPICVIMSLVGKCFQENYWINV